MLNKDKRSKLLSFILGDGCLHMSGPNQIPKIGYIAIKHGHKQKDYVEWKAKILSELMNKDVKVHSATSYVKTLDKSYAQYKIQIGWKRMRAWRRFCYPNNKKSIKRLLKFIHHPDLAAALWWGDDGSVSTGIVGNRKVYNPNRCCSGFVLYLGDISKDDAWAAHDWFSFNFNIKPRIRWQTVKYKGIVNYYPELRFSVLDSLKVWKRVKYYFKYIPSMMYKFRLLEELANRVDLPQP